MIRRVCGLHRSICEDTARSEKLWLTNADITFVDLNLNHRKNLKFSDFFRVFKTIFEQTENCVYGSS